jgi:hypothetical protein
LISSESIVLVVRNLVAVLLIGLSLAVSKATLAQGLAEVVALNERVEQLYNQGPYPEAIPLVQRVLRIREAALGPNHPDVATSLNNLAIL